MMSISFLGLLFILVVIGLLIVAGVIFLFMQDRGGRKDDQRRE
jgi:hypothetical protein